MKKIISLLLVTIFSIGSANVLAHCGNPENHADKTKEEEKDKEKDA